MIEHDLIPKAGPLASFSFELLFWFCGTIKLALTCCELNDLWLKYQADINCDLGEGSGNDRLIMPYITSCNIACGGHTGDPGSMLETIIMAQEHQVRAGAHPSYPDRENFGRSEVRIEREELLSSLKHQVESLLQVANSKGIKVYHLKPHGALYNKASRDEETARLVIDVAAIYELILYSPYGSVLERVGRASGLTVWSEAFLDRNYNSDLSLRPRAKANAVISDRETIVERFLRMLQKKQVVLDHGEKLKINAQTFCIHGDENDTPEILRGLHQHLQNLNIQLK